MLTQGISIVATQIVNFAFASSSKKDQEKFQKQISELDLKSQQDILDRVQRANTELERQKIVFEFIDKSRIYELKKQNNKKRNYLYASLGVGVLLYAILLFKLKK
jgi:uncharacterized transporter YbjL